MLWLITLLVLAVAAFFVVKMMKSNTQKQQAEHDQLQRERLGSTTGPQGSSSAPHESHAGTSPTDSTESSLSSTAATAAAAAGVTATAMAAGAAATSTAPSGTTPSGTTPTGTAPTGTAAKGSAATSADDSRLASGDTLIDVREMIKILNLDGPDAARLQIQRDQLVALRKGDADGVPDAATLDAVASKLRQMLA